MCTISLCVIVIRVLCIYFIGNDNNLRWKIKKKLCNTNEKRGEENTVHAAIERVTGISEQS